MKKPKGDSALVRWLLAISMALCGALYGADNTNIVLSAATNRDVQTALRELFLKASTNRMMMFRAEKTEFRRSGIEQAEAINAQIMRRYQQRWDLYRGSRFVGSPPTLYPSKPAEILEGGK